LKLDFKFHPYKIQTVQQTVNMRLLINLVTGSVKYFRADSRTRWFKANHPFRDHLTLYHQGSDMTEHATLTDRTPAQGRSGYIIWECWVLILIHSNHDGGEGVGV
jgi:hypothetical protein